MQPSFTGGICRMGHRKVCAWACSPRGAHGGSGVHFSQLIIGWLHMDSQPWREYLYHRNPQMMQTIFSPRKSVIKHYPTHNWAGGMKGPGEWPCAFPSFLSGVAAKRSIAALRSGTSSTDRELLFFPWKQILCFSIEKRLLAQFSSQEDEFLSSLSLSVSYVYIQNVCVCFSWVVGRWS